MNENQKKYKGFVALTFVIVLCSIIIIIVGCGAESTKEPDNNPQVVLEEYYQCIMDGNYNRAYDNLANINRDSYAKDEFEVLYDTINEIAQLRSFRVSERERFKNEKVGFVTYEEAIKFDVVQTIFIFKEDKESTSTTDGWVVKEDGQWRVYREKDGNIDEEISNILHELAFMYLNGQGKRLDYREAATTFRAALKYNQNNPFAHFGLGISLFELTNYEEALNSFQIALILFGDLGNDEFRSHSLTWIGSYYEYKGNMIEARKSYEEALDIFPDNQWAIDGLKRVVN